MCEMNTIKPLLAGGPIIIACLTILSLHLIQYVCPIPNKSHTQHYRQQQSPHVGSSITMEWMALAIIMGHFIVSQGLQVYKPKNGANE